TRELSTPYLEVHGITSMMDVPIWHKGRLYGVLCHEHVGPMRRWTSDEETLAGNLADLASLALEESEGRNAERRWDAVVNSIQEAVFVLDSDGTIVQANPLAARMIERAGGGTTLAERMELVEFRDEHGRVIPPERTGGDRSRDQPGHLQAHRRATVVFHLELADADRDSNSQRGRGAGGRHRGGRL